MSFAFGVAVVDGAVDGKDVVAGAYACTAVDTQDIHVNAHAHVHVGTSTRTHPVVAGAVVGAVAGAGNCIDQQG